jgi:hypothetical protein
VLGRLCGGQACYGRKESVARHNRERNPKSQRTARLRLTLGHPSTPRGSAPTKLRVPRLHASGRQIMIKHHGGVVMVEDRRTTSRAYTLHRLRVPRKRSCIAISRCAVLSCRRPNTS